MTGWGEDREYPLPRSDHGDERFTFGLLVDVAHVIERHGYPPVRHGLDLVELQMALFGFLYAAPMFDPADDLTGADAAAGGVARPEIPVEPRSEGAEGEEPGDLDAVRGDDRLIEHLAAGGEPDDRDPIAGLIRAWVDECRRGDR